MSGRQMNFHTAVSVVCQEIGFSETDVVTVQVRFRDLNDAEIERYLRAEQPYDCAGSAKSEGLGIALLDAIDRKSTRLNSSHLVISYAVFCLKKKKKKDRTNSTIVYTMYRGCVVSLVVR